MKTPVFGIVGWKNSGKTTLTVRLVAEFTRRGLRVATVKHAHHDFQVDDGETDSARHRRAGAVEVAVVSSRRWAIVHELLNEDEPSLDDVLARLSPVDLIIAEGYKRAAIPKIELRREQSRSNEPIAAGDPHVVAIATDYAADGNGLPVFALDDVTSIADAIAERLSLPASTTGASRTRIS